MDVIWSRDSLNLVLKVKVKKDAIGTAEDFSKANVWVMLIGCNNRYVVPVKSVSNGVTTCEVKVKQAGIDDDVYGVKVVWVKNGSGSPAGEAAGTGAGMSEREKWMRGMRDERCFYLYGHDHEGKVPDNGWKRGDIGVVEIQRAFSLTSYQNDANKKTDVVTLEWEKVAATYGYDGLDAYERAVMLGVTSLSEKQWVYNAEQVSQKMASFEAAETARGIAEELRVQAEEAREAAEQERSSKVDEVLDAAEAATSAASAATTLANTTIRTANTAANTARDAAQSAAASAASADAAAASANNAAGVAQGAANTATSAAQSAATQTSAANTAAAYATQQGNYAKSKGDEAGAKIEEMEEKIEEVDDLVLHAVYCGEEGLEVDMPDGASSEELQNVKNDVAGLVTKVGDFADNRTKSVVKSIEDIESREADYAKSTEILEVMQTLGDGEAVSAQVAINTTDVRDIKNKIGNEFDAELGNYTEGYRLSSSSGGIIEESSAAVSPFIEVQPGAVYKVYSGGKVTSGSIVVYNADKNKVDWFSMNDNERNVTIPTTASFLRITIKLSNVSSAYVKDDNNNVVWSPFVYGLKNIVRTTEQDLTDNTKSIVRNNIGAANIDIEPLVRPFQKVLCLGDSLTEGVNSINGRGMGYPKYMEEVLGCDVVNCGIGGTRYVPRTDTSNSYHKLDALSLITAICDENFDETITAAIDVRDNKAAGQNVVDAVNRLANIDYSSLDAIVLLYGGNDYSANSELGDVGSTSNLDICGCLTNIINMLSQKYPHIQLYIVTSPARYATNDMTDDTWSSNYRNDNNLTMEDITKRIEEVCHSLAIPCYDLYHNSGFNKANFAYWYADHDDESIVNRVHPSKGYILMAHRIGSWLRSQY